MKTKLTILIGLCLNMSLFAQDLNNITWDTILITDGDTTLFTMKGAPEYIDSLRKVINIRLTDDFENQEATDFEALDMDDYKHSLYDSKGQVVVLYFWAVYDQSSYNEYVSFNKIYEQYTDKGVKVLGLCDDNKENINSFLSKREIQYPIIPNCKEYGLAYYGGKHGSPRVFVIDKMGIIRYTIIGGSDFDKYSKYKELKPVIDNLLKE